MASSALHIALAGNIGSGKTTLAGLLAKHLNYRPEFEDPTDNAYIADFYTDMQRWAFNLQIFFLTRRLQQTVSIQRGNENVIQDRTLYEDAEIFAPNLLAMGLLSQRDYDTYRQLYDVMVPLVQPPTLVVYLRAGISTLVDQIAKRNRAYEDSIRIDYLKRLNERYEAWFETYDLGPKLDVDVDDLNFRDNAEDLGVILQKVSGELFGLFGTEGSKN